MHTPHSISQSPSYPYIVLAANGILRKTFHTRSLKKKPNIYEVVITTTENFKRFFQTICSISCICSIPNRICSNSAFPGFGSRLQYELTDLSSSY